MCIKSQSIVWSQWFREQDFVDPEQNCVFAVGAPRKIFQILVSVGFFPCEM